MGLSFARDSPSCICYTNTLMPHIHTEPGQHDTTVSAFIFRMVEGEMKVLLHLHKKFDKLLQPGGHVELHENPWQAIAHELREETGYELTDLDILQPAGMLTELPGEVIHPIPSVVNTHAVELADGTHYHTDSAYTFIASDEPRFRPHEGESTDLRWLTIDELTALPVEKVYADTVILVRHGLEVTMKAWQRMPAASFRLV